MVAQKEQEIPVHVRFVIERYEDSPKGKLDEVRKEVIDYANKIVTSPPEGSIVTFAQYFDLVEVIACDRYEDDEDDDERVEEDRYCVELTYIARFVIKARSEKDAYRRVFDMIDERCEDCVDESIEHFATNLNCSSAFSNKY